MALSAVAVASVLLGGLIVAPASSAQESTDGTQVTVLGFNDFHGRISDSRPSTVAFADTIETLRKEHGAEQTALISAGDNVGASLFASSFEQDQPTIDVLNALGLQASAVGNHEFDKGIDDLQDRIEGEADWSYLGANVTVDGEQMQPNEILDVGGIKVGVVGAVTEETSTLVSPSGIEGVEFSDPVDAVNAVADDLRDGDESNGEADVVVASYHEGAPTDESPEAADTGVFSKIAHETSANVSAIYTAHTHGAYDWEFEGPDGEMRPVMQTGSYGANIGSMTFDLDPETKEVTGVEHELVPVPDSADNADLANPVVSEVKEIVDSTLERATIEGEKPVGTVTDDITTAHNGSERDDRLSESALGNLVGEYMIEAVVDRGGAEIAFMNPGGLRDELLNDPAGETGNINKAEANGVLPFANTIVTMDMTGEQIKTVLEQQWQPEGGSRPFLALGTNSDLTWTFDPTRAEGDKITSISFQGQALDPARTYKVVSQSFLAGGGDNFFEFANASNQTDTGLIDSDTWMDYLSANDPISPNFAKHAVAAKDLPDTVTAGETTSFTLSDVNLTSLGATQATTATVTLGDSEIGTFDASTDIDTDTFGPEAFAAPLDGHVTIDAEIPADAATGDQVLTVELDNGTVITVPVTVAAGSGDGGNDDDDTEAPAAGSLAILAPVFGSSVALLQVLGFEGANAEGSLAAQTIGS